MTENWLVRTEMLLGREALEALSKSTVAVFGLGGVGSWAAEALARSGVGRLVLFDHDTVAYSNINRQLVASHSTIGRLKVEVMAERIRDINPKAEIEIYPVFFDTKTAIEIDFSNFDYIVDAIDTVSSKLELIIKAKRENCPVISSMGAGNKLDPSKFQAADIYETSVCPLAKVMRKELRQRGVASLKVVYSKEPPLAPASRPEPENKELPRKQTPGSVSFVPPAAGLLLAGEVIKELTGIIPRQISP